MTKLFLITGSTDGIGNKTAQTLLSQGDDVILHGRNPQKLKDVQQHIRTPTRTRMPQIYQILPKLPN